MPSFPAAPGRGWRTWLTYVLNGLRLAIDPTYGSPTDQMFWSFVLGVAFVSTAISLGVTAFLVVIFMVTFAVGAVRFALQSVRGVV